MQVIATAGHVDHGKSTLVRALTGMEPDRWAEEHRRGLTIDLGYAWTTLPSGAELAFVDVPGHERFTTNMLAGVGPVPAAMLVVAADGGWSAQTAEHVAALDALGVDRAVVVVTRSDLAEPAPVGADVARRLAGTTLAGAEQVSVAATRGQGLDALAAALDRLVSRMPAADTGAPVRLWVDRSFTMQGFGTVVTGTLGAGQLAVGDRLEIGHGGVVVRGLQRLGRPVDRIEAVARAAVNIRGLGHRQIRRGQALLTPGGWHLTTVVDVRLGAPAPSRLPRQLVLHVGSAAAPVGVRPLDPAHLRLQLSQPLPLRIGDRALLRDPGGRHVVGGVVILDPAPPSLAGRGAARRRSRALEQASGRPDADEELARRDAVPVELLRRMGVPDGSDPPGAVRHGGWLIGRPRWEAWQRHLLDLISARAGRESDLVDAGVPQGVVAERLDLPEAALVAAVVSSCPALELEAGRVRRRGTTPRLDGSVQQSLQPLLTRLAAAPFRAPEASELAAAKLTSREVAAAAAAGLVLRLPGDVILLPDAPNRAAEILADLDSPFDLSTARQALGTTRRVVVPLMEHLDRLGVTTRTGNVRRLKHRA